MREKLTGIFETSIFKWAALFVLVFTLSLPVTAKESFAGSIYTVSVAKGYLALRTAKAYDSRNADWRTLYRRYGRSDRHQ